MADSGKVSFSELAKDVKNSVVKKLAESGGEIKFWKKGSSEKKSVRPSGFFEDLEQLVLSSPISNQDGAYLCSFQIDGMNFFANFELKSTDGSSYFKTSGSCYKSERRHNFRINFFGVDGSNALIPKGKQQEPSLSALNLVDVSVTGASFLIEDDEAKHYKDNQILEDFRLTLRGKTYVLPEVEIVYRMDFKKNPGKKKMAVHFHKIPSSIEEDLFKLLTNEMRFIDIGSEFEEFLK